MSDDSDGRFSDYENDISTKVKSVRVSRVFIDLYPYNLHYFRNITALCIKKIS